VFVRRKEKERRRARELRAIGWSLGAIATELDVSKSSVSVWVRDIPRAEQKARRRLQVLSGAAKTCGRCERRRPIEFFSRHPTAGRQHWCRECFKAYFRKRGARHRAQVKAGQRRRIERARDYVLLRLERSRCQDCGETHVVVLDLDHVRGEKSAEIARLAGEGAAPGRIEDEMEKCDVVCANCHRRRTEGRRGSWRERAHGGEDFTESLKASVRRNLTLAHARLARGCADCGETDVRTLEFDHVAEKRFP